MKREKRQNNKGFALLFSVLLASFLLTIGLSIFSIALKELSISTAARQSVRAFFAADSGRECALYWDTKRAAIPTLVPGLDGGTISCGTDTSINLSNISQTSPKNTEIPTEQDSFVSLTDDGRENFRVQVTKTTSGSNILTTVISYGYDSEADDRVERAIQQTY